MSPEQTLRDLLASKFSDQDVDCFIASLKAMYLADFENRMREVLEAGVTEMLKAEKRGP